MRNLKLQRASTLHATLQLQNQTLTQRSQKILDLSLDMPLSIDMQLSLEHLQEPELLLSDLDKTNTQRILMFHANVLISVVRLI